MNLIPVARILSECAVYFTLLLMVPVAWLPELLIGTALLCALGCAAAGALAEKTILRCLCAVLPLLSLLIPADLVQRCCMMVPVAYTLLLILGNRVYADLWLYSRHLKLSLIFELLFLIIGCTLQRDRALWILFCGNVYFIFGIYYQHQLRLGGGVSLSGRLRDLAGISLPPLGAAAIVGLIAGGMKPISHVVIGIVTAFGAVLRYVVELSTHLYRNPKIDPVKVTLPSTEATEATVETLTEGTFPETWPQMQVTPAVWQGLLAAGILALLGLLVYGIYRFEQRPAAAHRAQHWAEANGTVAERSERTKQRDGSNRRRVRRIYSTYLRLLQGKGMFRRSTDTSKEVLEAATPYADAEKGSDLRSIYIRARYHTDSPVPDEDVQAAGEILKEIKKRMK